MNCAGPVASFLRVDDTTVDNNHVKYAEIGVHDIGTACERSSRAKSSTARPRTGRAVKLIGRDVTGVRADSADLHDLDGLFETAKQEKGTVDVS